MTNEIEKIIKEAADKIARIKGKEYAPTSNEIQNKIDYLEKGKLSPVEWFAKEDGQATIDFLEGKLSQIQLAVKKDRIFEQAKQMEKEQLHKCASFWRGKENEIEKPIFQQYYKETYGK